MLTAVVEGEVEAAATMAEVGGEVNDGGVVSALRAELRRQEVEEKVPMQPVVEA